VKDGFHLPLAKGFAGWIDADTLFVSTDFGEGSMTDSGYPRIVKRWKRGTPLAAAKLIYEADVTSVSASASRLHSAGDDIDLIRDGKTFWTSERYQLIDGSRKHLELPLSASVNGAFQGRLIISL
jgi:prolyl oligopeptidase